MGKISTTRSDVVWNYIGTAISMGSGFILLPLLMWFLSSDQLGLWYVFVAISNFALLFEFGFNPTFARNIVYVLSGARKLSAKGRDISSMQKGVDWHLLNIVIKASRVIYACISIVVLVVLATIGSAYIAYICADVEIDGLWLSWIMFCVATFLNLYFLWSTTVLRGYGDIAGEKKAATIAKVSQLVVSAVLLCLGFGLIGASIGFLSNAVVLRIAAIIMIRKHKDIEQERKRDSIQVKANEIKKIFSIIVHIAWRDGVVQLALFASSQATTILASLFLSLAETGTYSIFLQFGNAVCSFATAYPSSFYPAMQSSYAEGDKITQRRYSSSGIVAYWALFVLGLIGVSVIVMPLLPIFKPDLVIDYGLFIGLSLYLSLLQQHSIFCNYIIGMNEIPYMKGYVVGAVLGVVLVYLFAGVLGMGVWGLVLGQFISQIIYNNWRWPSYYCAKIDTTYRVLIQRGMQHWLLKLSKRR